MARTNLVLNPSWETGLGRWTVTAPGGSTPVYNREINAAYGARSGSYYAFAQRSTNGRVSVTTTDFAPVTAGLPYTASIYVNRDSTGVATLDIDWYSGNGTGYLSSSTATLNPAAATWARISVTGTAPAGATYARMFLHFDNMVAGNFFRFDAALFEQSTTLGTYFDGSLSGYFWTGTAHDSTSYDLDARAGFGRAGLTLGTPTATGKKSSTGGTSLAQVATRAGASGAKAASGTDTASVALRGRPYGSKFSAGTGETPALVPGSWTTGAKWAFGTDSASFVLGIGGSKPREVPPLTGRPPNEDPLPMAQSRYLVQNILTGEWLHEDLPLSEDLVTIKLSGACEITGKITPELADLKAPDGSALLRSWGHIVYLEMDGEVRAGGLITEESYDDQTQTLACSGISAYPAVIGYQGNYRRYFANPVDIAAQMWDYAQSASNANLGVQITRSGNRPTVLYGAKVNLIPGDNILGVKIAPNDQNNTDDDQPVIPIQKSKTLVGVYQLLQAAGFKGRSLIDSSKASTEAGNVPPADTLFVTKAGLEQAYNDYFKSSTSIGVTFPDPPDQTSSVTIEPYKVDWWDSKFCGDIVNDMAKACPADYIEQYAWNYPHTNVDLAVQFAYPRTGRRRDDLRFVQGENILEPLALKSDPDSYATCVVGIGAGEGSEALREVVEIAVPGRLRKMVYYHNTKITDRTELKRLVRDELNRKITGGLEIDSIVVRASHINAKYGSYNVGDDIPVQGEVPYRGWVKQWGRIVEITLSRGTDQVQIKLKRSDSFRYGAEVETTE